MGEAGRVGGLMLTLIFIALISLFFYLILRSTLLEIETLELETRLQAERIEQLEQERARLHWQLLAHLSEPGQEVNVYRN